MDPSRTRVARQLTDRTALSRHARRLCGWLAVCAAWCVLAGTAYADDPDGNHDHADMVLAAIGYDARVREAPAAPVELVLLMKSGDPHSGATCRRLAKAIRSLHEPVVAHRPVHVTTRTWHAQTLGWLERSTPTAVFVCPGLYEEIPEIAEATAVYGVTTISGDQTSVMRGVMLGIYDDHTRCRIAVNVEAARRAGARIHPSLLRMAVRIEAAQ